MKPAHAIAALLLAAGAATVLWQPSSIVPVTDERSERTARPADPPGVAAHTGDSSRQLVAELDAARDADRLDAHQHEAVKQLRREFARTSVVRCELLAHKVRGSYVKVRCLDDAVEIGAKAGDVVWAWDSTADVKGRFPGLDRTPDTTTMAVGDRRSLVICRYLWKTHVLIVGQ